MLSAKKSIILIFMCFGLVNADYLSARVTISKSMAVGTSVVAGVLCGATAYGLYRLYQYFSYDERALRQEALEQELRSIEHELNYHEHLVKHEATMRRLVLVTLLVGSSVVIGGLVAYYFLKRLTNEGRIDWAQNAMHKIESDQLIQLLAGVNGNWQSNRVLIEIASRFGGSSTDLIEFSRFLNSSLDQLAKAHYYLSAIDPGAYGQERVALEALIERYSGLLRPICNSVQQCDQFLRQQYNAINSRQLRDERVRAASHALEGAVDVGRLLTSSSRSA